MKLFRYPVKFTIFTCFIFMITFAFYDLTEAQTVIFNRTGMIKVIQPDGNIISVKSDEQLPSILFGSTIEVMNGSMDISATEGLIKILAGDSMAILEAGCRIKASLDEKANEISFNVVSGMVNVVIGNTTLILNGGEEVRLKFDKNKGIAEIKSIKGLIDTLTVGIKVKVADKGIVKISVDPKTRLVRVESVKGETELVSMDEKITKIAAGESMEIEGALEGEIQSFGEGVEILYVPAEEPVEPERPEASPHRP